MKHTGTHTWVEAVFRHTLLLRVWDKDFDGRPFPFPPTAASAEKTHTHTYNYHLINWPTGQTSHQSGEVEINKLMATLGINATASAFQCNQKKIPTKHTEHVHAKNRTRDFGWGGVKLRNVKAFSESESSGKLLQAQENPNHFSHFTLTEYANKINKNKKYIQ